MALNSKQLEAYNLIAAGNNVFITGGGGVGKSHIIKAFIDEFEPRRYMGITSTTGISAILIGGTTLHSYLGIGLGKEDVPFLLRKIKRNKLKLKRWKSLETLIIDEISMLNPELFDKLEEIARTLRRNKKPFGGIQLVLSGDFLQLPCINSDDFCFEAQSWNKCVTHTIYLKDLMRQSDTEFQECLNAIRIGKVEDKHKTYIEQCLRRKLQTDDIIPTILYPKNYLVDDMNNSMLKKEIDKGYELYEYDMVIEKHPLKYTEKYTQPEFEELKVEIEKEIDKIIKENVIPLKLQLCIGCQVMLLINLDVETGLVNGSKGKVIKIDEYGIPTVKFMNGMEVYVDFHDWEFKKEETLFLTITQVPLKLGYSFSIHKSQGATLDLAEIDLSDIFEYGMAYVALSRVKDIDSLTITNINWSKIRAHPKAVAYYETI